MHKNNKHKSGYDFNYLLKNFTGLTKYIIKNPYNGQDTIDFSAPDAVKALNTALLRCYYQVVSWNIPKHNLCPAIPGRVDYLHHLNDLLMSSPSASENREINVLDIGTGAGCIYPLLGFKNFGWQFTASDIDVLSINNAANILDKNGIQHNQISLRLQKNPEVIFSGIIKENEFYHLSLCNPPFHSSLAEAEQGTSRKWHNLNKGSKKLNSAQVNKGLNFSGQKAELWCPGGELSFIRNMIKESKKFQTQIMWFTCLVSKKDNLSKIKLSLKKTSANQVKVIKMSQGNKISRFIAWSYF